jgi:hypothetical protein
VEKKKVATNVFKAQSVHLDNKNSKNNNIGCSRRAAASSARQKNRCDEASKEGMYYISTGEKK